jgi:hypothetical protein
VVINGVIMVAASRYCGLKGTGKFTCASFFVSRVCLVWILASFSLPSLRRVPSKSPNPPTHYLTGLALFRAHATVAMILCTSGVAECIGHVLWEGDAMKALSRDGSSDIVMILAYLHLSE